MTLASLLHLTQTQPLVHAAIDWAAYATAGRVYLYERQRAPIARSRLDQGLLLGATIFGAALGAIGLHLLEIAPAIGSRPLPEVLGKSILGGLLGGTLGTEIAKRAIHWPHSTGDAWVPALVAGLAIGRLGCQLAGTWDQTYGSPTGSSLGWDYGDGIARYPTALLEGLGVIALWLALRRRPWARPGQYFNAFVLSYSLLRFALEFLKPPFGAAAAGVPAPMRLAGLTPIQWAALGGAAWMGSRLRPERSVSHA